MQLMWMPCSATSSAAHLDRPNAACLLETYALIVAAPVTEPWDVMLTIAPPFCFFICAMAYFMPYSGPNTLML